MREFDDVLRVGGVVAVERSDERVHHPGAESRACPGERFFHVADHRKRRLRLVEPRLPLQVPDIEEFGRTKLDWLRRYVPLANGIPVDDTIARIISALSVGGFQECFLSWMEDVVKLSDGEIIALDGKTRRRSHDRKRGVKALHMVSAWGCRNGVVLGQVKTQEKSNEIVAVPELLGKLELKGCIVTLDAMGCQLLYPT